MFVFFFFHEILLPVAYSSIHRICRGDRGASLFLLGSEAGRGSVSYSAHRRRCVSAAVGGVFREGRVEISCRVSFLLLHPVSLHVSAGAAP